ncbi:MAG: hypothetical protein F4Z10_04635 [Synechococcus sp. SB0666_bin_14]|nr:hypothetical protein [Synechococcus sp. SB0666_bin_14]
MAALGLDGILLDGGADGFSLTTTADFLTLQTSSEAVDGLASSEGNLSRFRLGVEASRPVSLANGSSLLPSMEIGIRQDSGDVETGFGMELGAGLSWNHPQQGISADLTGRTLLSHAEEDFQEQGLALSFNWDPNPTDRGPSFSVSHSLGAATAGGLDALLNPTAIQVLNADPQRNGQHRFEATLAYGLPVFNNRLTMTPGIGLALASDTTFYRLLWALRPYADQPGHTAQDWHLSLEAERQETSTPDTPVEHSVGLNFSLAGGPADVVKASVLGAALVTVLSFLF